jgi:hypothetical protein
METKQSNSAASAAYCQANDWLCSGEDLFLWGVIRQNPIRVENGAILSLHGRHKESAIDPVVLSGPRMFLLGRNVGAPVACIY